MTTNHYDDELLSAIIDGEADAETVASVEADSVASKRLAHMRDGVSLVAKPVPEATPERRSASIAAALAGAAPAPQVTSLTAARHTRSEAKKAVPRRAWIAGVAAAVAFLIAIPVAISLGGSSNTEATAADAAVDVVISNDDAATEPTIAASDDESEAMEDEDSDAESDSFSSNREEVEEAMADDEANAPRANRVVTSDLEVANNVDEIDDLIDRDVILPQYDAAAVIDAGVNQSCVRARDGVTSGLPYDLVQLDSFGGGARLILVEFADDGTTRVLDAEDCASLR